MTEEKNGFIKVVYNEDAEFSISNRRYGNPMELLEKLYLVRNEEVSTREEKNEKVKKIMREYME